jgi:glc operon protein GlcG
MTSRSPFIAALAALVLPFSAIAQTPAPPPAAGGATTLEQARRVMSAAEAEARRRNWTVAIAIVENNGALVLYQRDDDVQYGSVTVSMQKAKAAALFRRPTKVFADTVAAGAPGLLSIDGVVAVEGGVPILQDGRQIGGIGVSGMTAQQDGIIAAAGAAAIR